MYDILIIHTHRQTENTDFYSREWLGIYSLAALLEENGYTARIFAGFAHEVIPMLEEHMPLGIKTVGFSCDYENQVEVSTFCRMVKERWGIPVIVGGPQAVALGEQFLRTSQADVCVRGEGELPLLELMAYFVSGSGTLNDISGICFLQENTYIRTEDQPVITNLDALPTPDHTLFVGEPKQRKTAAFLTARGCPFRCTFCYEGSNTRGVRWRSVPNVISEVRKTLTQNPHIHYILFTDDTFTLNARRVRDFVQHLSELREEFTFGWFAEAHVATLLRHPEIVKEMIDAGLITLQIGVESGNVHILKAYNKKISPAMIEEVVSLCHDVGLPQMVANIIVGGAHETEESCAVSQEFGVNLLHRGRGMMELHAITFWPLPGTAITQNPKHFGMDILDYDSLTSATDYPVVRCGTLEPERIAALRHNMNEAFIKQRHMLAPQLSYERLSLLQDVSSRYHYTLPWLQEAFYFERCRRFVSLLHSGAAKRLAEIPHEEIPSWHPQRTCHPRAENNEYFADDRIIAKELYPVLVASAGRMTTAEAAVYCGLDMHTFLTRAVQLEEHMALVFCQF